MTDRLNTFDSFDGAELAWSEVGEGRPVVLFHGFFSDAATNWLRYGHAEAIAAIMPIPMIPPTIQPVSS